MIGSIFSFIHAQSGCTDGVHSYKIIDQTMTVSDAINANLLLPDAQAQSQSQYVLLDAQLIIDQDYHFSNGSDIIGTSNTRIQLNFGKSLHVDSTKYHGCGELAYGFILADNSKLFVNNSEIFNMNIAIAAYGDGIELNLIDDRFENNGTVIETFNNSIASTTIYGNIFVGGALVPPYGSGNTIAFKLRRVNQFTVGSFSESRNVFEGYVSSSYSDAFIQILPDGCDVSNSSYFEFINCNFNNTHTAISMKSASDRTDEVVIKGCDFNHTYIKAEGLDRLEVSEGSTFKNPISGFIRFKDGGSIIVDDCDFQGGDYYESNIDGISVSTSNYIELTNNQLDNLRFGIVVYDCLNLEGVLSKNLATNIGFTGIRLNNNICMPDLQVRGNDVSSFLVGISSGGCENISFKSNDISVMANTDLGEAGLSVGNSNFIKVNNNDIVGTNFISTPFSIREGIILDNSSFTTVECNTVEDIAIGFSGVGYSFSTGLIANRFNNTQQNGVSFDFVDSDLGKIGSQNKNGNVWEDISPVWNELQDELKANKFIISNGSPSWNGLSAELIPNPYEGNVVLVGGSGSIREQDYYCIIAVPAPVDKKLLTSDLGDELIKFAMQNKLPPKYCKGECDGYLSNIQYDILIGLYYNPQLLDSLPEAQIFWDDIIQTAFGKLFMAGMGMSVIENDNQIDSIMSELSNITTTELYEENLKKAFQYRLKAFKSGSDWSDTEIQELGSIANQCPKSGGKGVYVARTLLNKDRWDYDNNDLCGEKIEGRSIKEIAKSINILPNPNDGSFDIDFKGDFDKVVIYNSFGKMVYQEDNYEGQTIKRIFSNLSQGMYFIKIFNESKLIGTQKLEIIK